ncbi:MAG: histidinol-phosphatase [Hyphomicrobium sp.]|nr:MAG: histidinol-phosphatase [Hyphomicrobium sp.]
MSVAHDLADRSASVILRSFRRQPTVENKASGLSFDPVTEADRGAERVMTRALRAAYPSHGIVGEELGQHPGDGRFEWVIDPIDGTRAFIMGSPLWGTLIGVREYGAPYLGVMNQPFTRERFWSDETSSFIRMADGPARRIKTRACSALDQAILTSTHPDLFEGPAKQKTLAKLKSAVRMTRYGGDCYGYCLLAAGYVDLIVESGLKPYDIVALIPIIERAGGRITTWDGKPAIDGGNIVASGDPRLHDAALELIAKR